MCCESLALLAANRPNASAVAAGEAPRSLHADTKAADSSLKTLSRSPSVPSTIMSPVRTCIEKRLHTERSGGVLTWMGLHALHGPRVRIGTHLCPFCGSARGARAAKLEGKIEVVLLLRRSKQQLPVPHKQEARVAQVPGMQLAVANRQDARCGGAPHMCLAVCLFSIRSSAAGVGSSPSAIARARAMSMREYSPESTPTSAHAPTPSATPAQRALCVCAFKPLRK